VGRLPGHRGGRRRRDGLPALLGAAALADLEGHLARGGAGEVRLPGAGELIIPPYTSPERSPSHRAIKGAAGIRQKRAMA